jgi:PAS domain S-box-containing protein
VNYAPEMTGRLSALRIIFVYALFAAFWIYFSEQAMGFFFRNPDTIIHLGVIKGLLFILVTAALLYRLIIRNSQNLKQAEKQIRESAERLNLALAASRMGVWEWDIQTNAIFWSPECLKIMGVESFSETIEQFTRAVHPEDVGGVMAAAERAVAERTVYSREFRILARDGEVVWLSNLGRASYDDTGRPLRMIGTLQDISERKQAEEALLQEKAFTENALNTLGDIFFVCARDGSFLRWNKSLTTVTGYDDDELAAMKLTDIFVEEEHVLVQSAVMSMISEGRVAFEALAQSRDGRPIQVEITGSILKGINGDIIGVCGTGRDISERKRAELEREELEAQLRQAQKIEAVGRLAGGVAHDFNNMLSVILGYADIILAQLDPKSTHYGYLRQVQIAGQRSADLTRQLLAFSRKQVIAPVVMNLNLAIQEHQKMLARLIGEEISIEFSPAAGLWNIRVDPSQIDQILANLAVNARDAISGVGTVAIETSNITVTETESRSLYLKPGDHVLLVFSDSGCGMDARTRERIFEPFFTTKGEGKGTGLGLATVYGIVKQNEGAIHVESEPGKGTLFRVYFPRFLAEVVEMDEVPGEARVGGRETVLVVEDEGHILELARAILEEYGYRVLTTSSPEDACRICAEYDGHIHLLLSDVVMPAMNGKDLKERVEVIKPGIRTLFMSGYTSDIIAHRGVIDHGVNFIRKPFTLRSLVETVRAVLDTPEN